MSNARDDIIDAASRLLEQQGYHATGLNQIVAESGAPKGSLYHYFPDGKDEISEEALRKTGRDVEANIRRTMEESESAAEGIRTLLETIADQIEKSGFRAGGPITTVALESAPDNERLSSACADVYESWRAAFRAKMVDDGIADDRADRLAGTVLSTTEGAIVLTRTYRDRGPLVQAAETLASLLDQAID